MMATAASAQPLISGILFDPEGYDEGKEWIEIYNPADVHFTAPCLISFGNGASQDDWSTQWHGNVSMPAGSYLLIGEEDVSPEPDFTTGLNLQNGPDAIKLICNQTTLDLVGWGEHSHPEYYETTPADPGQGSLVLSRIFIDTEEGLLPVDTDNNAEDFSYIERIPQKAGPLDTREINVTIFLANHPPVIEAIENCTDDDAFMTGLQIYPGIIDSSRLSCDMRIVDPNGAHDIESVVGTLYHEGQLITNYNFTTNATELSLPMATDLLAGDYILRMTAADGSAETSQDIFFTYVAAAGFSIEPSRLVWQDVKPGQENPSQQITLRNKGNTMLDFSLGHSLPQTWLNVSSSTTGLALNNSGQIPARLLPSAALPLDITPHVEQTLSQDRIEGAISIIGHAAK